MVQKVLIGLLALTVVVLAVLVAYLATSKPYPAEADLASSGPITSTPKMEETRKTVVAKEGETVSRAQTPSPPPPPKAVANPDRIRQNLVPGKTYLTHLKGTFNARGSDANWGIEGLITINYGFEAFIDRVIESNDGTTVVEVRHFRDVRSVKADCKLTDVRLDLGPFGRMFLPAQVRRFTDNLSLKPLLTVLPWAESESMKLLEQNKIGEMFGRVDGLSGKSVRIKYEDGKGVLNVEPLKGEMTAAERDFHMSSVLVSDALIFPNMDVKEGDKWSVDGSNFSNFIDPSLLARTAGQLELRRAGRKILRKEGSTEEKCILIEAYDGRLRLDDSTASNVQVGHFDPRGTIYFSEKDKIVAAARLEGKGKLERASQDHLLFQTRMTRQPTVTVSYTCKVEDTPREKR